jgi:DUF1680 family protein
MTISKLNICLLSFVFIISSINAQYVKTDALKTSANLHINGFIGDKLNASYQNRIMAQDVDKLISPFRNRTETKCWQSEFWGKWFTSAVLAYKYRPEPALKAVIDRAVSGLISTQTPDGYIGNYASANLLDQWDIWGRKYCMLGLLDYYDLTGDKKSLDAARKLADNLMADLSSKDGIIVTKGNHRGMAASSVLEPICNLYAKTKEKKYLDFAELIVKQWETPQGPQLISKATVNVSDRFPKPKSWFSWDQGQKAYEMMSCYEGLLELYRLTGKEEYKKAVELTWQNIRDREINLAGSGSAVECWFGGKDLQANSIFHYQETCVTATWIKLSHQLLRLTGEAKYADAAEQTYYNALLGSMTADGANWAKYTPLSGQRLLGSEQCGMGLNCCEASGPRGLFNLPLHIAMTGKQGIQINYYVDGTYKLKTPSGQELVLTQRTDYPSSGKVVLLIDVPKEEKMAISVRIPSWSNQTIPQLNGRPVEEKASNGLVQINRSWKKGDSIVVEFNMKGRIEKLGERPEYIAIMRGPILLTRDSRLPGPDISAMLSPVSEGNATIQLEPVVPASKDLWVEYSASFMPESYVEGPAKPIKIHLCDYASAGNGSTPSLFKVWLPQLVDPRALK